MGHNLPERRPTITELRSWLETDATTANKIITVKRMAIRTGLPASECLAAIRKAEAKYPKIHPQAISLSGLEEDE